MTGAPDEPFAQFCQAVTAAAGTSADGVASDRPLVDELGLDELSLARVVMAVEQLNPYFWVPDQLDLRDMTLDDLYHYYRTMSEGHLPADD